MVRRTEGSPCQQGVQFGGKPRHGIDLGAFNGFLIGQRGKDVGQTGCQHAFTRAGRPDEHDVVHTRRGNLQGLLGGLLSFDLREIRSAVKAGFQNAFPAELQGLNGQYPAEVQKDLPHVVNGVYVDPRRGRSLGGVFRRTEEVLKAVGRRRKRHGQRAVDGAERTGKGKLAHKHGAGEIRVANLLGLQQR